ncbi:MAG: DUF3341 domain-containing protein [Armatimonadetes bacterium]|nr:DUF3341 domain-containing protein [Armatimonadota bacterium]
MTVGIGAWGLNRTVGWGFDITNFVFWVGIGHAGTLISAVLFLFRQKWRTSINRAAEAMTIFAVMCAATFPLIHMGRPWYFYWILPYPNNRGTLWVNFRSPLLWDFFAISTYFIISLVFWYIGMIPDLATLRDRAKGRIPRTILGFLSHGWNGSARIWHRYETIYALLALLATPLVVSVHSIVSFDFCTSVIPGWHTTLFPPYFVVGAVFSGFAMVLALLLVTRKVMGLEAYITPQHLNWMCKVILAASVVMGSAYGIEFFIAWYSGNQYELAAFVNRATGPYWWAYWLMVFSNVAAPQVLWLSRARRSIPVMLAVCLFVSIGMWFERFVIIVTSLHRDYLPSSWTMYAPTANEAAIMVGMFGLFFALFLLFTRALPVISIAEIKGVLDYARGHGPLPAESDPHVRPAHDDAGAGPDVHPAPPWWRRRRSGVDEAAITARYCVAYFEHERDLLRATREARRRGYRILDAFSPFAVHGLSEAMGLRPSRLTWIGAWAGIAGLAVGLTLQVWVSVYDWPLRVGGQPFNSWPVFIPVAFELTVLFAGLIGVGALFARTGMWPGNRAPRLARTTDDRFALALQDVDASVALEEMMATLGAEGAVTVVEGDELA